MIAQNFVTSGQPGWLTTKVGDSDWTWHAWGLRGSERGSAADGETAATQAQAAYARLKGER